MHMLTGKVALVTGAGSGIGKAVALAYASTGARVVVSDINDDAGKEVATTILSAGGEAIYVRADTGKPEAQEQLVRETLKHFGALHIACNNAGIAGPISPVGNYPIDGWDTVVRVNLSGVFYGMRYQIPAMLATGEGSIVNIASILGVVGTKNSPAYVAAKHGVVGLTQSAALEYAQQHIRVNAVGPGYIKTPLLTNTLDDAMLTAIAALHPMARLGEASEVAELVVWLSAPASSFATGAYYAIDGGYLAQ